jgi:hypothetical protein
MEFVIPPVTDLRNESDVEAKLIMPLLTALEPTGLSIAVQNIQTKANIRRFRIGKGTELKSYYPDYIIVFRGLPVAVIEAKAPGEDLMEGFREARLYACELNAVFPSKINPLGVVIASNGTQVAVGRWDQGQPTVLLDLVDLRPYCEKFESLQQIAGRRALQEYADVAMRSIRPEYLKKPRRLVGGMAIQQEDVGHNTFGATIAADFASIFNPSSREDRSYIARNGYIPSLRRIRYVDPIDRVIRAARPASEIDATQIEDSSKPKEVIDLLKSSKQLEHQVLLIVGSVGSGKTTFVDHLEEVALPREIVARTQWVRINMNAAPIAEKEIYDWLRREIINGIRIANSDIDFEELESLRKLYSVEIGSFNKGRGRLYPMDSEKYNEELARCLEALEADLQKTAVAYSRYCATERGKLLILVFDNCDKRLLDEQLLMFQAAQWVQRDFRALVILPLREETYDNYRNRPPLDTALKDLVFRIEPPLFQAVLVRRVQLALSKIRQEGARVLRYELPNGFHVEYPAADQAFYLTSIVSSIFEHDRYIRRMITGLAGRNLRRALEIFLEFCNSGHIGEDEIFRIRQSEGKYSLPLYLVTQVLVRLNRRYYDSDHSYIKNLFDANRLDEYPVFFARLMILRWLQKNFSQASGSGLKGYLPISRVKAELTPLGLTDTVVMREIEYLAKALCVLSEDFRTEGLSDDDLVRLAPAGFVHLELVENVTYLAAAAEDTVFDDEEVARRIADRIMSMSRHYEVATVIANASDLVKYLKRIRQERGALSEGFLERSDYGPLTDVGNSEVAIDRLRRSVVTGPWADAIKRFEIGSQVEGRIVNRLPYGLLVELEGGDDIVGLVHQSRLPRDFASDDRFLAGEQIRVGIRDMDAIRQRVDLEFAAFLED